MFYKTCDGCGHYVDDGSFYDDAYICHGCDDDDGKFRAELEDSSLQLYRVKQFEGETK